MKEASDNLKALMTGAAAPIEKVAEAERILTASESALRVLAHHDAAALAKEAGELVEALKWIDELSPDQLPAGVCDLLWSIRKALWKISRAEPVFRNDWRPYSARRLTWRERITGRVQG
jgi:hypothetical protein